MPRKHPPAPEQVLDPTLAAGGQSAALYASHFSPIHAQPSPASVGLTAGLARLDTLLQHAGEASAAPAGARARAPAPTAAGIAAPAAPPPAPLLPRGGSPDAAGSALLARLRACLSEPLLPDEAAELACSLEAAPALALAGGVAPEHMPALIAANPAVAVSLVACVAAAGPAPMLAAYLDRVLPEAPPAAPGGGDGGGGAEGRRAQEDCGEEEGGGGGGGAAGGGGDGDGGGSRCGLTLRNLEVAYALLQRRGAAGRGEGSGDSGGGGGAFLIPRSFLGAHLTAAMTCVAGAAAGPLRAGDPPGQRARLVRLVSLYIRALLVDGLLRAEDEEGGSPEGSPGAAAAPPQPSLLLLECASFALAHAGVAHDAALLYKEIMAQLPARGKTAAARE
jgi:hypothetical protein